MSFVHCHQCHWSQDDFWSEHYNPINYLQNFEKDLLTKDIDAVCIHAADTESCYGQKEGDVSYREMIARSLERAARHIRKMAWRNMEEYKAGGRRCPKCGGCLDID
jgi:hypothetical protein